MRRIALALLLAIVASPALAQEEGPARLEPPARVRVRQIHLHPPVFVGTLVSVDTQTVVVQSGAERYTLPIGTVRRLEVSAGRRSGGENVLRGAARGALYGLAFGAIVGGGLILSGGGCTGDCFIPPEVAAGFFMVATTATGATFGALAGAASPLEQWTEVPLPLRP